MPTAYGYRYDPATLQHVRDPAEQVIITRILRLRDAGRGYAEIAQHLMGKGVPARGARWYASTVRTICIRGGR